MTYLQVHDGRSAVVRCSAPLLLWDTSENNVNVLKICQCLLRIICKKRKKLFRSSFAYLPNEVNNNGGGPFPVPSSNIRFQVFLEDDGKAFFLPFISCFHVHTGCVIFALLFAYEESQHILNEAWHDILALLSYFGTANAFCKQASLAGRYSQRAENMVCNYSWVYVDTGSSSIIRRFHLLHEATRVAFSQLNLYLGLKNCVSLWELEKKLIVK